MSILRADFSPSQAAAVDEISERTGLSFSAVVRMLLDDGLSARSGYRNSAESLPEGNSKRGGEGETPESQDPTVIETERKGSGGNGESVSVPKRSRKIPVAIPDPPTEIDSPELRAFLPEFVEYRRKVKKSPLTPAGWNLLFNRLKPAGREHAVLALRYSISNGWKSFDVEWLKGKSWATVASEMGLSLTVAKPAPAPAVLDARDLARAIDDARKEIPKLAPAQDGWTSKSRTVFFEDLDACKTPAEVEAHLAACRALCDRLRSLNAFPLRRATQPGEILPAGGGARIVVDLRTGFIGDTICPACGGDSNKGLCSCGDRNDPAVGGLPMAPWPECDGSCGWPVTTPVLCGCRGYRPDTIARLRTEIAENERDTCEHGTPYRYPCVECDDNPDFGHGEDMVGDDTPLEKLEREQRNTEPSIDRSGTLLIPEKTTSSKGRGFTKVADGQHAYAHDALSGKCAWCGQGKDHIRHYLPHELPFNVKEQS